MDDPEQQMTRKPDDSEPLAGLAFKIMADQFQVCLLAWSPSPPLPTPIPVVLMLPCLVSTYLPKSVFLLFYPRFALVYMLLELPCLCVKL